MSVLVKVFGFVLGIWLVVGATAELAEAQHSGGSFGGGSFSSGGGGGGYSGGGGGYSGGGGGYSGGGYSGGGYSGGGYSGGGYSSRGGSLDAAGIGMVFVLVIVIGGFVMLVQVLRPPQGRGYYPISGGGGRIEAADVSVLRIGLDARVRPYVQKELDRIARAADTSSQAGLVTSLHEVALMLRRVRDAWVYGGAHNFAMTSLPEAEGSFRGAASRARASYRDELVRNAGGVLSSGDTSARPIRSDEGSGLVLVHLIVAARRELMTVQRIGNGDDLRRALEVLSELTAESLIAVEVVWTPADPADRMSSVELEALLPGEIFPIQGAMVGKVVCGYCSGPFPAELMSCPHCGAPARAVG